jgi:IS5 family transposase
MRQRGFFDEYDRLKELSKLGDPLEKLNTYIDWEQFRGLLRAGLEREPKGPGGRPAFDYVMMFKILILQRIYNISDAQAEYQVKDRLSFMRFLGLTLGDRIPDEKTIWEFRDKLMKAKIEETAFRRFTQRLEEKKIITYSGSLVDASFVEAPRQRNSRKENEMLKEGKVPEDWEREENRSKRRQKDTEARWAKKNDERHYGYKDHIKVDKHSKLITRYTVTDAAVRDSRELKNLIEAGKDKRLYADSAYTGKEIQSILPEDVKNRIHEKGYRGRPLTKKQERENKKKSHPRVRVEHVFGHMTQAMGGMTVRCIGLARAKFVIGLMNLTYNLQRYVYLRNAKRCVSL